MDVCASNTQSNHCRFPSSTGTSCGHLDEDIFDDELMTGYVDLVRYRYLLNDRNGWNDPFTSTYAALPWVAPVEIFTVQNAGMR